MLEQRDPPAAPASRASKAPDSACSVGNSQSQRSGSSKSRASNSNSSASGSSGYGGHPSTLGSGSGNDAFPQPRSKDKDHRKKKLKAAEAVAAATAAPAPPPEPAPDTADAAPRAAALTEVAEEAVASAEVEAPGASTSLPPGDCAAPEAASGPDSPVAGLHRVAFSQSLSCISKAGGGALEAEKQTTEEEKPRTANRVPNQSHLQQPSSDKKDEFTVVVSMQDGAVIYTSPSITQALSFPRDMWVGKSFIDYVHSDDRLALIQHITSGVALPRRPPNDRAGSGDAQTQAATQAPLFCRLRRYPSLREGFAVAERGLLFSPFSLRLSFYELPASEDAPPALPPGVLLTITATAVISCYTQADETPTAEACRFATRHLADGQLTHVDGDAVPLLGFLPQQLVGRPVFDLYHPADMRPLQLVYKQLVSRECETPLRGQPYRLRAHNGCYIRVYTEWSSFVNPWTRRLEFVIGQHHVLKGPSCPDVFAEKQDEDMFSEELLQDGKAAQAEICRLLQEEVRRNDPGTDRRDVSRRCKDLASFMETLIGEIGKPGLRVDAAGANNPLGPSFSERSSVTLGEISPHHDYYDSKSSSETPPSYNQLNYNDNIQRFFESKPKTIPSDDSGERLMALEPTSRSTDEEAKPTAAGVDCRAARKCLSPVNDTGSGSNSGSGSGSAGLSANNGSVDTAEASGDYKPPHLTEALLSRHNEDMEKKMVQRHREQRSKGGEGKCKKQQHNQQPPDRATQVVGPQAAAVASAVHGTKRSGSHSWDGEPLKASKHSHAPSPPAAPPPVPPPQSPPDKAAQQPPGGQAAGQVAAPEKDPGLSLWPPFSITVTPLHAPQPCNTQGFCMVGCCGGARPAAPHLLPLYYLPSHAAPTTGAPRGTGQTAAGGPHPGFLQQQGGALPYVAAGVLYQAAAPLLYPLAPPPPPPPSHLLALHQPLSAYQLPATGRAGAGGCPQQLSGGGRSQHQHQHQDQHQSPPPLPRPASCATSVKVEPGSSAASVTASVLNRGASDGSQKGCRTSGEDETEAEDSGSGSGLRGPSSSSYCYSFLRSDGDSCRDATGLGAEDMVWERMDNSSSDCAGKRRLVLKDPPWLENVQVTPELMFQYQMSKRELDAVLEDDLQKLRAISQPLLVNEQLGQLYLDMARSGADLRLEEGELTSSSSGTDSAANADDLLHKSRKKRRNVEYSKLVMIFEENAPMPSPLSQPA